MASITIIKGGEAGKRIEVGETESVLIGRKKHCAIRFDEAVVSADHARIEQGAGGWTIADLGSSNGTTVNGRRVTAAAPLDDGAVIGLGGDVQLRFHAGAPAPGADEAALALVVAMQERTERIRREVAKVLSDRPT